MFRDIFVIALAIAANGASLQKAPVNLLSLSRHFNVTGSHNILQSDQARARHLKARVAGKNLVSPVNSPATNQGVLYTANVGVGDPPTYCKFFSTLSQEILNIND